MLTTESTQTHEPPNTDSPPATQPVPTARDFADRGPVIYEGGQCYVDRDAAQLLALAARFAQRAKQDGLGDHGWLAACANGLSGLYGTLWLLGNDMQRSTVNEALHKAQTLLPPELLALIPGSIPVHVAQRKVSTGIEPGFRRFEAHLRILIEHSRTHQRPLADDEYVRDATCTLIDSLAGTLQSLRPAEGESLASQRELVAERLRPRLVDVPHVPVETVALQRARRVVEAELKASRVSAKDRSDALRFLSRPRGAGRRH